MPLRLVLFHHIVTGMLALILQKIIIIYFFYFQETTLVLGISSLLAVESVRSIQTLVFHPQIAYPHMGRYFWLIFI